MSQQQQQQQQSPTGISFGHLKGGQLVMLTSCIRFRLTRGTRMAVEFIFRSAIYAFLLSEFPAPPPVRRTSTRAHKA